MAAVVNAGLAQKISAPNPFALITSTDGTKTNIMALSWWTYCSNKPMTIAVCINDHSYSGRCVAENKQFCLCLPGEELAESAFLTGTCSGEDTDKAQKMNIELVPGEEVEPQYVKNSRLVLECRVKDILQVSDHRMFIAEVVAMHVNPDIKNLMAVNGYGKLSTVEICAERQ